MGTPDFAVASLKALLQAGQRIKAVVTAPDKPAGRGMKLQYSAVKQFALEHQLPLLQPEKLKDESFIAELKKAQADYFIVVAFRMLPEVVWSMPPKGCINVHASLLPYYRGAAPINWAIIRGEKKTGVSTFFITHEIDTGSILLQKECAIEAEETAGSLHDKLMSLGADCLTETLERLEQNQLAAIEQQALWKADCAEKTAPKLTRENCRINWSEKASQVHDFCRGLNPYPGAYTFLSNGEKERQMKVFDCRVEETEHQLPEGALVLEGKSTLKVACGAGFLVIDSLQAEGKKKMKTEEWLRGVTLDVEARFK
jgi:methionyl-tRNA formyltransferase